MRSITIIGKDENNSQNVQYYLKESTKSGQKQTREENEDKQGARMQHMSAEHCSKNPVTSALH